MCEKDRQNKMLITVVMRILLGDDKNISMLVCFKARRLSANIINYTGAKLNAASCLIEVCFFQGYSRVTKNMKKVKNENEKNIESRPNVRFQNNY